jgi:hypothetical protein
VTDDFDGAYRRLVRAFFGTLAARDVVPDAELDRAEQRLGFGLPPPIRTVYRRAGRHAVSTKGHHVWIAPHALAVQEGALLFLRERQNVASYGIRMEAIENADPPVVQRTRSGALEDDCPRLSPFLLRNLCWQTLFVAGEGGKGRCDRATFARMKRELEVVEHGKPVKYPVTALRSGSVSVCAFEGPSRVDVYVASRSRAAVDRIAKSYALRLDAF